MRNIPYKKRWTSHVHFSFFQFTYRYAYESQAKVEVRVARIFNTFGPRMHPNDGRVVSNFIIQVCCLACLCVPMCALQTYICIFLMYGDIILFNCCRCVVIVCGLLCVVVCKSTDVDFYYCCANCQCQCVCVSPNSRVSICFAFVFNHPHNFPLCYTVLPLIPLYVTRLRHSSHSM